MTTADSTTAPLDAPETRVDQDPVLADEVQFRQGRRRVGWLTAALAVLNVPVMWWLSHQTGEFDIGIVVIVGLLFLAGEIYTVDVEFRHESQLITFISIPLVVGLLILPPAVVVALRVVTMLVVFAGVQRQPPFKLAFNACSAVLDVFVVAATIAIFVPDGAFGPGSWLVVFVAVVAGDGFSAFTTTLAISCFQGRWEPAALSDLWMGTAVALADVVISVVLVTLFQSGEPAALLVLAIGAFLLVLTRAYARVTTRYRSLELLDRFTQALGESVVDDTVVARLLRESADILHAERSWLIVGQGDDLTRMQLEDHDAVAVSCGPFDRALVETLGEGAQLIDQSSPLHAELAGAGFTEVIAARLASAEGEGYVLAIAERSGEVRPFDRDDVSLFDTLAIHAGLALQNLELVDKLRNEVEVTEHLATHDALTALPNRILFQQRLDGALALRLGVAVLLIDLDRFKEVNDTLGHHNGDLLLVEVGRRLAAAMEDDQVVARLGGDEFAVLLKGCDDEDEAIAIAQRLVAELERPFALEDVALDVGGSVGIAMASPLGEDGATLLRQADVAMYVAKADHTTVEVYSPDRDHYSPQRLALVGKLRSAIEQRKLVLFYQPQIDLASGSIIGVEALIRWPQPGRNPIPPDEFIYVAEHTGLIHPLTQFVLEEAIAQAALWHRSGRSMRVSLNLSAYNLVDRELVDEIARLLDTSGLPPSLLMVELTETAVMSNPTRSVAIMNGLRDIGVDIAIDDFGTGHSSLAYLTGVPATELKIDKSFVFAMGSDPAADTIVRTIIDLGHNLGLGIVAEGVETEGHAAALKRMGCSVAQGYFYSRPLEVRGFELWLEQQTIGPVHPPHVKRS